MKGGEDRLYPLHPGVPDGDPKPSGKRSPTEALLVDTGGVSTPRERRRTGKDRTLRSVRGFLDEAPVEPSAELKAFADNIPDGIFRLDRKLRHVFMNNVMLDLFRKGGERNPGSLDDWDFLPGEAKGRVKKLARKTFSSSLPQELELMCDGDGSPLHFALRLVPEAGAAGHVGTVLGIMRDITSLKRNEAEIETEHSFREAIGRSLSIGIGAIDHHGRQIYVNPAFCRIVGWTREELLGSCFPYVYWPENERRKARKTFLRVLRGGRTSGSFEVSLQRRDGTRFDALVMYSAFYDNSGKRIGWIGSVGDVSGLKRKEKELQRLNRDLDAIVRKRTDSLRVQNRNLRDILMGLNKAQEELRLSETRVLLEKQRLETILNVVPAGVVVMEGRGGADSLREPACPGPVRKQDPVRP